MGKIVDLTGKKFGRWTVSRLSHRAGKALYWACRCECGNEKNVFGGDLKRGESQSCGCRARELRAKRATSHSMSYHKAYRSFQYMRQRCENEKSDSHHLYGKRGIKICKRWSSFEKFWEDMGPTWKPGLSIERKNVNGDYKPSNCCWATPAEQAMNRRSNHLIDTPLGKMPVTQAARNFGILPGTVFSRIRNGWDKSRWFDGATNYPHQQE